MSFDDWRLASTKSKLLFYFFIGNAYWLFKINICLSCIIKPWVFFPICFFMVRLSHSALYCSVYSHVQLFVTLCGTASQTFLSFPTFWRLLKLVSESTLIIRWPKYWSFSFSISPSNEYLGFVSFRIYCFDLLVFQGTLKSLLQNHSSTPHQFFGAQLYLCSNSQVHTWLLGKR